VRFRTIHQFKGLESDVVILLLHKRSEDIEEKERYLSDELLYVGFTRAKHLLYVVNVG
jgi:ATP-dependent exoDNAse (exonuclease V) alpha subunit